MTAIQLETLLPALVAVGGVLYAMARWVGKVDRNTEATDRLTEVLRGTTTQVQNHEVRLENHEIRISTLEKQAES